jgi:hypothetical protein
MSSLKDDDPAVEAVRVEWNKAEKAIKLAEQINGEIVNPAIYELRYAGRRLMEAISESDEVKFKKLLGDAHFDCCRARHDAIDAATSKMVSDLKISVDKLGADIVLQHFPDFTSLFGSLSGVRKRIAISREDRDNREAIYAAIEKDTLPDMVDLYNNFLASESLLKESAKKRRSELTRSHIFGWGGLVLAAILAFFVVYDHWPKAPESQTAVGKTETSGQH